MEWVMRFGSGFVFSGLVGLAALKRRALTRSGAFGAAIVGTIIWGGGGWAWGLTLITFFALASLLSRYKESAKITVADQFAKGSQRDLGQALANGGIGALLALGHMLNPSPIWLAAFVGAMASVSADTWATELGVLSARSPRLVTTWKPVEPGTSGGVSALGSLASMAGALAMGLTMLAFLRLDGLLGGSIHRQLGTERFVGASGLIPIAVLGGSVGSLFDSLLGATVQAIYYSPSRGKETERPVDPTGAPNMYVHGWRWMTNDAVNCISSLIGAMVGALVGWLL